MLKRWQAVSFRKVLENGRTKPLVVECIEIDEEIVLDPNAPKAPNRREFLVKGPGNPEVDNSLIARELLGNLLARKYGLQTPEPALVTFSESFVRVTNPALSRFGFQIRSGIAAGCEYLRGGLSFPTAETVLSDEELIEMALLYGFDLASQNPDRLPRRPNCAIQGKRLVAFDFDQCFSFLYLIGNSLEPWEVSKHGIAHNHLCHKNLHNKKDRVTWIDNVNAIADLSDEVLNTLTEWIQDEWGENAGKVRLHLTAIRNHLGQFELELQESIL